LRGADDLHFTVPVLIPGRRGATRLRTVQEAIDWIDGSATTRRGERFRDIGLTMRHARLSRRQELADDASDRLVRALADLKILRR
jgi:hypothetical protein